MRVLLVEDETRVAGFVARGLREHSYAVDVAGDGDAALYQAAVAHYDLVVLDVMLPGKSGTPSAANCAPTVSARRFSC